MKKIAFLIAVILAFGLPGCSLVKEGITGESPEDAASSEEPAPIVVPAAFRIIGDWFGIYNDSEYLMLRFTADGKCELQPAVYPSDMFGPRYFGEYVWGGEDGREIILDLYQGQSKEIDYGDGFTMDEWTDGGREAATTALMMTFRVFGSDAKSFAVKAVGAGIDTEGYTVVQAGAFVVMLNQTVGGNGNPSPFLFGTIPYDPDESKSPNSVVPDNLLDNAVMFYNTDELNVRCGPGTDYKSYGTIPVGTSVWQIGSASGKDEWAFVLLDDGGGWVHTDYLSATKPDVPPPESTDAADTDGPQTDD